MTKKRLAAELLMPKAHHETYGLNGLAQIHLICDTHKSNPLGFLNMWSKEVHHRTLLHYSQIAIVPLSHNIPAIEVHPAITIHTTHQQEWLAWLTINSIIFNVSISKYEWNHLKPDGIILISLFSWDQSHFFILQRLIEVIWVPCKHISIPILTINYGLRKLNPKDLSL